MLSEFFPRGHARYAQSPAALELEEFCAWLVANGYSRGCIREHLFRLRDSLDHRSAMDSIFYTIAKLQGIFGTTRIRTRRSMKYRATQRAYQRFLISQGRLVIMPPEDAFAEIRHKYRRELIDVRGLSSATVAQHERTIGEFLSQAVARETLRSLTSSRIDQFLALKGRTVGRHRLQHVVAHLRSFLGFCRANGEFERPLEVIDSVRIHRDELPPKALPWPLLQALLRSIDRSSRSGWRDYTILHLAAHYGLRPSEIVSLRLDSINWHDGTLKVEQRKTHSILLLPLADRTISILRRYLQHGRPNSSHPQLFLRARCPAGALTRYAITDVFETRAARSGLSIEGYSVYSLRHAFAMRLLHRGVGVKTIGDLLGHRHLASTCQYLRLELEMLRGVALPVPGPERGIGGSR